MSRRKQPPPIAYTGSRQSGLSLSAESCPTCGRAWEGLAVKICRACGETIAKGHKYRVVPIGPGVFAYQHRDCAAPTSRGKA